MSKSRKLSRQARWTVPAGAVAIVGVVAGGTLVSAAQAAPALPARTAAQLLAGVQRAAAGSPPPMIATIAQSAALGLPALPDLGGVSSTLSAVTAAHTVNIWYRSPAQVRIAEPVALGETDLRVNGRRAWLWQSSTQTATRLVLPAGLAAAKEPASGARSSQLALTPAQAVSRVLAAVGPTTAVSVQQNVMVAGQAAYELRIAPRDSGSLVGQIRIDIDAKNYLPLRLQVFARGAAPPAFQLGYTALSFGRPAVSNFTFTPPRGATVKTEVLPSLPGGRHGSTHKPAGSASQVRVLGKDWLSVAVVPAGSALATLTGGQSGVMPRGQATYSRSSSVSPAYSSTLKLRMDSGLGGQAGPALQLLLRAARPVHGAWGSGRLLRTALVSVLLTSKGEVLVGAVRPSVLYADAALVK